MNFKQVMALIISISTAYIILGCKGGDEPSLGLGTSSIGEGDRIAIDETMHFVYRFNKRPAMGTVILKVQVFGKSSERVTSLAITGDSGMPSMKGAHDSGEVPFSLSKNGDYLLPVSFVMPGGWRIKLKFLKDKAVIYRGDIDIDI